jgi:hypothetical protein
MQQQAPDNDVNNFQNERVDRENNLKEESTESSSEVDKYQTTRPVDKSDRDKSARKRVLVGPYVKTTRTVWKDYSDHQ